MATEAEYIRISELTRLRIAYRILCDVVPSFAKADEEEWKTMLITLDKSIAKLERRRS